MTRILTDSLGEEALWELWKEMRHEFPRQLRGSTRDNLIEHAARLVPILAKYRLDRLVLLGGFEMQPAGASGRSRARMRLVW